MSSKQPRERKAVGAPTARDPVIAVLLRCLGDATQDIWLFYDFVRAAAMPRAVPRTLAR